MDDQALDIRTLLDKNLVLVRNLEKKASMFGKGMLILSLLDVIFGILAIFCTSLQLTALFASATSLTAITICGRVIQISKIRQLDKSLKTLNWVSIAWIVNRYPKYVYKKEKIKMTKSTKLQKILTTILSVFGVGGVVVYFFPQFTTISQQISNIVAMASEVVAVVSGIWLSTTSDKVLTAEEIAQEEKKIAEKELEKVKKEALKELKAEQKKQISEKEQAKIAEKEKAEAEYRAKVEAMKIELQQTENK